MKTLLTLGVTVALLVAAWLVSLVTPDEVAWRDGYPIVGAIGEEVSDRNVRVTITSVTIADEVTEGSDSYPQSPGAVWVVVGVSAQALTDETEGSINHATLTVDGAVYRPSDRGRNSMEDSPLFVAAPTQGYITFEIPEPRAGGQAELRLGPRWDVDNADTYLSFPVDLSDAERVPRMEVERAVLGY